MIFNDEPDVTDSEWNRITMLVVVGISDCVACF